MAQAWSEKYGSVVWAKFKSFPWWPAFIIDPQDLAPTEESYKQAQKEVGKSYCVVFYGDHTTGIIKPAFIREFNEEVTNELKGQKLSARYQKMMADAIVEAYQDASQPKEQRFSWYFNIGKEEPAFIQPVVSEDEEEDEEDEEKDGDKSASEEDEEEEEPPAAVPAPRKRGRPPKRKQENEENKKDSVKKKLKTANLSRGKKKSVDDEEEHDDARKSDSEAEPEEEYDEEGSVATDGSEPKEKKQRGRKKTKNVTAKASKKSATPKAKSKKEDAKKTEENGSSMKIVPPEPVETTLERLMRWRVILLKCHEDPKNELALVKSRKLLMKLAGLSVTIQELKDSGVGKMINKLMDHPNPDISGPSQKLKQQWIELSKNAGDVTSPSASQPLNESQPMKSQTSRSSKLIEEFDEAYLSEEVKNSILRNRTIRLFTGVVKDLHAAIMFEELLFKRLKTLNISESEFDAVHSEFITRVFVALKEMTAAQTKDLIASTYQDESNFGGMLRKALLGSEYAF